MRRKNVKWWLIAAVFVLVLLVGAGTVPAGMAKKGLQVHFIDVGQGDSTLIVCDGEAMMIDFGDNSKGTYLQNYLKKQNVKKLKYAIGTHPDADHIGGMDVIITKFDIDNVFMPNKTHTTATYRDVVDACTYKRYKIKHPKAGKTYKLGSATFQVLAPNSKKYQDTNGYSIVIRLTYKKQSFLFMGDAPVDSENEILKKKYDLESDVLKVGHHGSYTATSANFLKKVNPKYAVISCGRDNSYGHPHNVVMKRLKARSIKLYRTDLQGTIIASVNTKGKKISWNIKPSTDYSGGTSTKYDEPAETKPAQQAQTAKTGKYVLNISSKKIHLPGCDAVGKMSEKNKEYSDKSLKTLQKAGYTACQLCLPGK